MYYLFKLFSYLPLRFLQGVGAFLGLATYYLSPRFRRRLQTNAGKAGYVGSSFYRKNAAQIGRMFAEMPKVWFHTHYCIEHLCHLSNPQAFKTFREHQGNTIFVTPHLGCFEILARFLSMQKPIQVMYRPPRVGMFAQSIRDLRDMPNMESVPANIVGVRSFMRTLHKGGDIGVLPDQVPKAKEGVWVPFFGDPAYTITLPGRLAKISKARVIVCSAERLPKGKGWRLRFLEGPHFDPSENDDVSAYKLNLVLEDLIRLAPDQYLWSYNRYKERTAALFEGYSPEVQAYEQSRQNSPS